VGGRRSGFWLVIRVCRETIILRCAVGGGVLSIFSLSMLAELSFISSHWLMFVWIEKS